MDLELFYEKREKKKTDHTIHKSFDEHLLQKKYSLELTTGHNSNAISKQVSLIHEVCGEQNGSVSLVLLDEIPGSTTSSRIHTRCRLIKNNNLQWGKAST